MTIEDYLEILAGTSNLSNHCFTILDQDKKLIHSLSQQIKKKIALTDRQHQLIKKKLLQYNDQLVNEGFLNLHESLDKTRQPYRTIDRSKTITLATQSYYEDFFYTATNVLMLAIRFPFSKKMIKHIDLIKSLQGGATGYDSKSKTHFLKFNEHTVYTIIDKLKTCNFTIDQRILDFYHTLKKINDENKSYKPGIYDYQLLNTSSPVKEFAYKTLGPPTKENLLLYHDRKDILGLKHFDNDHLTTACNKYDWLTKQIALRNERQIFIKNTDFTYKQLISSLHQLNRYPILIILGRQENSNGQKKEPCIEQLYEMENLIQKNTNIPSTVLFRLENTTQQNKDWNTYIKENHLNSSLDADKTKVVYINSTKLPKPLLKNRWKPNSIIVLDSSRLPKNINLYCNQTDLVIFHNTIIPYYNHMPLDII